MSEIERVNGIIESTFLGYEDHGILTFYLYLKFDCTGQGFGGYACDSYDKPQDRRVGHAFLSEAIGQILKVLKKDSWEKLPGTPIRVERASFRKISKLGHFVEDKWIDLDTLAKQMQGAA